MSCRYKMSCFKVVRVFTHHLYPRDAAKLYIKNNIIAIGFVRERDVAINGDKEEIKDFYFRKYGKDLSENKISNATGHFLRFRDDIDVGDFVIAYEGKNIVSAIGEIDGPLKFNDQNEIGNPNGIFYYPNQRKVKWKKSPQFFDRWKLIPELAYWVAIPGTVYIKKGFRVSDFNDIFEKSINSYYAILRAQWSLNNSYFFKLE